MALRRTMQYVFKNGEFGLSSDGYRFVGGSPLSLDSSGNATGNVSENIIGVAFHSYDVSDDRGLVTVILPPALLTLDKGTEEYNGLTEDDTYNQGADASIAPWDETRTYSVGDVLRPTTVVVSGSTYAVWTNADYTGFTAGTYLFTYPAKVKGIIESGGSMVGLEIVLEPTVKQVVIT